MTRQNLKNGMPKRKLLKSNLRIAINAQIAQGGGSGGVETVLRVLGNLGQLGGAEEYVIIGHWTGSDWVKPFLNERMTLISAPNPADQKVKLSEHFKDSLGKMRPVFQKIKHTLFPLPDDLISLPISNGFYESLNCDVIHFPFQEYVKCDVPSVYNPHDLQHLHYPQFFTAGEISRREIIYPAACRAAQNIVVATQFVKQDIIENYNIAPDKIQVIPWSPPEILSNEPVIDVKGKFQIIAESFVLYPAMTWEHKNHLRLLEAIAQLRDHQNLKIHLVCTGFKNSFFPKIEQRMRELHLENQVKFVGMVAQSELRNLYKQAQFVIIPTLFEAASAPLFEAWQHNVAVACSAVTSLPEQAADAALLFNPFLVEEIAGSLKKMTLDKRFRDSLCEKGRKRLLDFNLERTTKAYRAIYRKTAGVALNDEDQNLLEN